MDQLLHHHGDVDAAPGLLDFAVNVRGSGPPEWLHQRLVTALGGLGRYPCAAQDAAARAAVAARHSRDPAEVLVLGGVAEGFALLPALAPRSAAVVHPSFTEPEVALRRAGIPVNRVLTDPVHRLKPAGIPAEADLVVLGNPTNPTSVLHPAEVVRGLARPGRVLVVDEAFADAEPGERESLAADRHTPGLLVFRSLTKTWALPGLRAGYALGPPDLLARLASPRPPWPVSTLVLEAVRACCSPAAVAEAAAAAVQTVRHREWMACQLADLPGVTVHQPAAAPFLLLRVPDGDRIRTALAGAGIAVRRADTFPGLTPNHLRVAVRPPEIAAALIDGLRTALAKAGGDLGGFRRYGHCPRFLPPHRSLDDRLGAITWEAFAVNADPAAQRRLLDLAAVDAELTRAVHRRRSLPELAEVKQAEQAVLSTRDSLVAAQTATSDLDRDIRKLEAEIDQVRARRDRDRGLLDSGSISSGKQLEDLQHELATLQRRQTVLEDDLLEVMERREVTAAEVERGRAALAGLEQRCLDAAHRRDAALAELESAEEHGQQERRTLVSELPADLIALYERIRARNGTGAALLRECRCGSCRLELDRTAIGHLREAPPGEVVRCEECGVILVRTAESGL